MEFYFQFHIILPNSNASTLHLFIVSLVDLYTHLCRLSICYTLHIDLQVFPIIYRHCGQNKCFYAAYATWYAFTNVHIKNVYFAQQVGCQQYLGQKSPAAGTHATPSIPTRWLNKPPITMVRSQFLTGEHPSPNLDHCQSSTCPPKHWGFHHSSPFKPSLPFINHCPFSITTFRRVSID